MPFPPNIPTSPTVVSYDRGQQAYFFTAVTGNQTLTGTTLPPGSTAYGLPPATAVEQGVDDVTIQVDVTGTATTTVVHVLGSLDGVNFYDIGALNGTGGAGIFSTSKVYSPGFKFRYISAYVSAIGTATSVACSMFA